MQRNRKSRTQYRVCVPTGDGRRTLVTTNEGIARLVASQNPRANGHPLVVRRYIMQPNGRMVEA